MSMPSGTAAGVYMVSLDGGGTRRSMVLEKDVVSFASMLIGAYVVSTFIEVRHH